MVEFLTAAAILLMAIVAAGLVRLLLGPGIADRLMAVQLLGTGSAGMLLLSASAVPMAGAVDVALVLGLLAALVSVALVKSADPSMAGEE
jgi:multicomponent Na+:H+ antiporter subunit F